MSKVAYQPTVLVRAEPSDSHWISTSAKVLRAAATFATMIALFGAVAICSNGFGAFTTGKFGRKGSAGVPVFPATKASSTTPAHRDNAIGIFLPDTNESHHGMIASNRSTSDQTRTPALDATPLLPPVAQPESRASLRNSASLERERPEATQENLEGQPPKAVRKDLEKERREIVRKRSRLEEMYQKRAISSDAYKKGEKKYKSEIERYRRAMTAG